MLRPCDCPHTWSALAALHACSPSERQRINPSILKLLWQHPVAPVIYPIMLTLCSSVKPLTAPLTRAGGYHELLLGPEKDEVIGAVRDWILAHAAAPSAKL